MRTATPRRSTPGNRGFSLVELIVSMVLIAILLWPMLANMLTGARGVMKTGDVVIASNLCAQALEIVRNKPFANLLPGNDPLLAAKMDEKAIRNLVSTTFGETPKEYNLFDERFVREMTLEPIELGEGDQKRPGLVKVVVKCDWRTKDGKPAGPLTLCTLVANEAARFGD